MNAKANRTSLARLRSLLTPIHLSGMSKPRTEKSPQCCRLFICSAVYWARENTRYNGTHCKSFIRECIRTWIGLPEMNSAGEREGIGWNLLLWVIPTHVHMGFYSYTTHARIGYVIMRYMDCVVCEALG